METVIHIRGDERAASDVFKKEKPSLFSVFSSQLHKIGGEDSRKFIHSIKVGLALVLVSLLYLVRRLYDQVGDNAMWAIMTVVVMFEFYAGATLSKGLNRGMGTIVGGGLGCLAAFLARQVGKSSRAVAIGVSVFIFGSLATYARMIPSVKKKFDYGAMIFILTFNLIAVSGARVEEIIKLTIERLITIAMGFTICIFVNLLIFPIWASDELHGALVDKFDCLARSIEDCLQEYFNLIDNEKSETSSKPNGCLSVLYSKAKDESLANFARWEPWHGKFGFRYPGNKYLHIAKLLRELAASVFALKEFLHSHTQWSPPCSKMAIKEPCEALGTILSFILTELGDCIFKTRKYQAQELVASKLHSTRLILSLALSDSKIMKVENGNDAISGGLLVSFVISLMNIANKVEALAKEVEELGVVASFPQ
ncbi:aluminum-activated malate transporter 12-like [Aristolochia californica]|uniref:aluminum-activated malate transporter 12-like n=1 Tax=Aristolochia californica TaxID=171875 RepID=UPI0035D61CB3